MGIAIDVIINVAATAPAALFEAVTAAAVKVKQILNIDDLLTRVVISYEIYETSLRRVSLISYEMITRIRSCLSFDPFKWDFIAYKINIISARKRIVDTDVVNNVTSTRQSAITRVVIRFL